MLRDAALDHGFLVEVGGEAQRFRAGAVLAAAPGLRYQPGLYQECQVPVYGAGGDARRFGDLGCSQGPVPREFEQDVDEPRGIASDITEWLGSVCIKATLVAGITDSLKVFP